MLEVNNLSVRYGGFEAVKGIDLKIKLPERLLIYGKHGGGKTSFLKGLFGTTKSSGEVFFNGKLIKNRCPEIMLNLGITLVPEDQSIFPSLTLLEHLKLVNSFSNNKVQPIGLLKIFPELNDLYHEKAYVLSGGQVKMLSLVIGLARQPRILVLDEPFAGVAEEARIRLWNVLLNLQKENISLVVTGEENVFNLKEFDSAIELKNGISRQEK